jgi:hypothetical protein
MYFQTSTQNPLGWRGLGNSSTTGQRSSRSLLRSPMGVRRRRMLGDDASVLAAAMAAGGPGAPSAALVSQTVQSAMSRGGLWTTEDCTGIVNSGSTAQLITSAGGKAAVGWATTAIAAGATGPLAPIVLAVGGILQVFGAIFGHHAAKVKQEQQIICAVVQAVNDSLSVIDQAVQQGVITAGGASGSLDKLYSDLQQNVQPILKQDSSHCNAACFILAEARGVIGKRKEQYDQMARVLPSNAPQGSYTQTCRNVVVQGDQMVAECEDMQGNWKQTVLPSISACNGISNINGKLTCDAPASATAAASSGANPLDAVSSITDQLAASFNVPTWAVWGVGGLLAAKLVGVI